MYVTSRVGPVLLDEFVAWKRQRQPTMTTTPAADNDDIDIVS